MTHESLNKLCSKYGIKTSCQAGGGAGGAMRFMQFMPEEVTEPELKDLNLMVIVTQL